MKITIKTIVLICILTAVHSLSKAQEKEKKYDFGTAVGRSVFNKQSKGFSLTSNFDYNFHKHAFVSGRLSVTHTQNRAIHLHTRFSPEINMKSLAMLVGGNINPFKTSHLKIGLGPMLFNTSETEVVSVFSDSNDILFIFTGASTLTTFGYQVVMDYSIKVKENVSIGIVNSRSYHKIGTAYNIKNDGSITRIHKKWSILNDWQLKVSVAL